MMTSTYPGSVYSIFTVHTVYCKFRGGIVWVITGLSTYMTFHSPGERILLKSGSTYSVCREGLYINYPTIPVHTKEPTLKRIPCPNHYPPTMDRRCRHPHFSTNFRIENVVHGIYELFKCYGHSGWQSIILILYLIYIIIISQPFNYYIKFQI